MPEGVYWSMNTGHYVCDDSLLITRERMNACTELDIRLDTFTRCQETMGPVMSLIEEMVNELDLIRPTGFTFEDWNKRAKQIIGREE